MHEKTQLRNEILKQRKAMSRELVQRLSIAICTEVSCLKEFKRAEDIAVYMPIRNEVDTECLMQISIKEGKRVWLPKVSGSEMEFFHYEGKESLLEGSYHIPEPQSKERLFPGTDTLIVMPGAVFSENLGRIGYGGGYYDRYLERYPICKTAALCYDFQILPEIPEEIHDIRPEVLISEKRVLRKHSQNTAN